MASEGSFPVGRTTSKRLSTIVGQTSSGDAVHRPVIHADKPSHMAALGRVPGQTPWNKFGHRSGLTASGGEQTIWEVASAINFVPLKAAEPLNIRYNPSSDGANSAGATQVTVYHIDANGAPAVFAHTLGSSGSDITSSSWGINRMVVTACGSTSMECNAAEITCYANSAGTLQATIPASGSVTQQAIFHVASGHTFIGDWLWLNAIKPGGNLPVVIIKGYAYAQVTGTRYEVFRGSLDTDTELQMNVTDPVGFPLAQRQTIWFTADTDVDNTDVDFRMSGVLYDTDFG